MILFILFYNNQEISIYIYVYGYMYIVASYFIVALKCIQILFVFILHVHWEIIWLIVLKW